MKFESHSFHDNINFFYNASIYSNQSQNISISSTKNKLIKSHNAGLGKRRLLESSFGEFYERYYLQSNGEKNLAIFNMINGDIKKINSDLVLFNPNIYNDSSGAASHNTSAKSIEHAVLEYYERQSLIHTWLNKIPGEIIDIENIIKNDKNIEKKIKFLSHYIDDYIFYNIGLVKDFPVILAIGKSKKSKAIGLASKENIIMAVNKVIDEMIEGFGYSFNKNEIDSMDEYNDISYSNINNPNLENYIKITPLKLFEKYNFLFSSEIGAVTYCELIKKNFFISELLLILKEKFNQDLFVCSVLKGYLNQKKVVKIYSNEGYPHMFISIFTEKDRKLYGQQNIKNQILDIIPFP